MSRDDIRKLIGGYATGTLTPEERQILFEAALEDQELFDELAREQALHDLLRDPTAKAHLLTALDAKPAASWTRWWRPAAAAMVMAGAVVLAVMIVRNSAPKPVMVAVTKAPSAVIARQQEKEFDRAAKMVAEQPAATGPSANLELRRESKPDASKRAAGPAPATPLLPADSAPAKEPALAKTEASPARDQFAEKSAEAVADAKLVAGAKALFERGRPAGVGGAVSGFTDPIRQPLREQPQQQQALRQQQLAEQTQSQAASAGVQQGQQSAMTRSKQVAAQNFISPATPLGIRYSVQTVVGMRFETNMPISADRPALNLESNSSGYLYLWSRSPGGAWRPLANSQVGRMQPYTAPPLRPGEKEVMVLFTRQARQDLVPPVSLGSPSNLVEKEAADTYIVNPLGGPAGEQVHFTIRLP